MPLNVRATTAAVDAIAGAQFAVHAVPVQSSRAFLQGIKEYLPASVPIICVSKGLEVGSGQMMSELIPSALERKQPAVFLSGPSFAKEVMQNRPTGVVAACKDGKLGRTVQALFASPTMRVNTTTDVVGVEICGALKNVLAIAAGIVEGMDLGHNALAALVAQGCSEIRWGRGAVCGSASSVGVRAARFARGQRNQVGVGRWWGSRRACSRQSGREGSRRCKGASRSAWGQRAVGLGGRGAGAGALTSADRALPAAASAA